MLSISYEELSVTYGQRVARSGPRKSRRIFLGENEMAAKKLNLVIRQGETFLRVIRWETPPFIYKAITGIANSAPVLITAVAHGLASGWRVAVVSAGGMEEINAQNDPPREHEFKQCTYASPDTITINTVNATNFLPYTSGGYLQFYTPVDLSGYSARMEIKDRFGGTVLESLTSGAPDNRIALDNANHTITLTISAVDTALLTFVKGYYDLELVAPTGTVTTIFSGVVTVTKEVTT